MTTPRVTVPVEPTEAMLEVLDDAAWFDEGGYQGQESPADTYRKLLAAAPAPEGGADAWRIRTKENLHGDGAPPGRWIVSNILSLSSDTAHWYEIQPLRVSEPSQADLDTMEAYGVKAAALATREEAPAEEGEVREIIVTAIAFLNRDQGTDRINATISALLPKLIRADAILRGED